MCCQADVDMYVMCRYLDIKINDFVLSINIYSFDLLKLYSLVVIFLKE